MLGQREEEVLPPVNLMIAYCPMTSQISCFVLAILYSYCIVTLKAGEMTVSPIYQNHGLLSERATNY